MKYLLILLASLFVLFSACKKNKVNIPESNDPIFKASGTFGSNTFNIVAGDDGAYMYTMTDIVQNVEVVAGKISNTNAGIEIGIFNGFIDQPPHQFEDDFQITPTFAKEYLQPLVVLQKSSFANASEIQTINWTIGNDQYQNSAPIYEPGKYMVCAEIIFMDNTIKNLCNELIIGYDRSETGKISFDFNQATSHINAFIEPINSSIESTQWFIDGVYFNDAETLSTNVSSTSHKIRAEIHYSNGVYRKKEMVLDAYDNSKTIEDFTFFENLVPSITPQDYNIRIKFHQNGITYESIKANNSNSTILITELSYYGKNTAGFDVYKINATVNCKVKAQGGTAEIPLIFTTVFGLEIK